VKEILSWCTGCYVWYSVPCSPFVQSSWRRKPWFRALVRGPWWFQSCQCLLVQPGRHSSSDAETASALCSI